MERASLPTVYVEKLVADNSFYRVANVPGGMYRGTDSDVQTFGVGATFVLRYRLTKLKNKIRNTDSAIT